jgi:hypothetical protein
MDMSYFSFTPKSLKDRGLKVAIVFLHEEFRFEVWLAGYNKQIQKKYWNILKENGFDEYPIVAAPKETDAIVEHILTSNPDFSHPEALSDQIEKETMAFIRETGNFLSKHGC